ncbi:MAG: Fe-S cluster assembly protein SufD [Ilumatobacteraceae bacterium]|nr:Fe-S cluster assembly protein SufD [Ilumatobacteraceae bacterium]
MPTTSPELLDQLASVSLPTADEEIWRYSRIGELDLTRYVPGSVVTTVDGPDDLVVAALDTAGLDERLTDAADVFAELNDAFMAPLTIRVPRHRVVEAPIVVTHVVAGGLDASGAAGVVFPRLVVEAGEASSVTVVERFVSGTPGPALVVPVLQVQAAQAARVEYLAADELGTDVWKIGHQRALGDRDSTTLLASVALGAAYGRVRTEARLVGQGGTTRQVAIYFAADEQMHDFRTIQDHDAPHTSSDLLFKGAVQDTARSVYTGLIRIREHARGTAAFQTNRTLTLSEGAWAESVPNLDIRTNDVSCSHASTVGPIDDDQRFYLESRGVPPEVAERLVVLGFFDEVIEQLPAGAVAAELRRAVADKLHVEAVAR